MYFLNQISILSTNALASAICAVACYHSSVSYNALKLSPGFSSYVAIKFSKSSMAFSILGLHYAITSTVSCTYSPIFLISASSFPSYTIFSLFSSSDSFSLLYETWSFMLRLIVPVFIFS